MCVLKLLNVISLIIFKVLNTIEIYYLKMAFNKMADRRFETSNKLYLITISMRTVGVCLMVYLPKLNKNKTFFKEFMDIHVIHLRSQVGKYEYVQDKIYTADKECIHQMRSIQETDEKSMQTERN